MSHIAGPMWDMPWGANAVYADDFASSVAVTGNTRGPGLAPLLLS